MNRRTFVNSMLLSALLSFSMAQADAILTYEGYIPVGQPLGRVVGDPVRGKIYGISTAGNVVFMDRASMSVQKTITTGRKLTDIDVAPDGSFMRVLDNVTNEYWNQPPATYVISYDLTTQLQSSQIIAQAPMYQMALGRTNRIVGVQWNQWVDGYQVNAATGSLLSTRSFGYYSGTTWNNPNTMVATSDGTRVFRTDVGISSIDLLALDASGDTLVSAGNRTVGSYNLEPVFINSSDSSLYVGDLRLNPWDISQVLGVYPENIIAATGDDQYAFGVNGVYDPASGATLGTLPVHYQMMTMGDKDRYLYAFDTSNQRLHVMRIVPEPTSLGLWVLGAWGLARRRRRGPSRVGNNKIRLLAVAR